jgi:uncharacterized protein (TIGR02300 family)
VAKPELGTKRVCLSCGTKYYDLQKSPITCPNCGTVFEIAAARERAAPIRAVAPVAAAAVVEEETEELVDRDDELVSLEDVEEEDAEDTTGDPALDVEDEVVPDVETIEVEEEEVEADDADPFLADEEEEGDDVSGLLDVDAEDEDEV